MEPKIVNKEAFTVMGIVGHFASAGENFGPLWQDYMTFHPQIEPLSAGEGHYGVYLAADHSQPLDYLAGMAVQEGSSAPEGVKTRKVPAALYAVFQCPFAKIGPTYGYIWGEWLQSSEYEQDTTKWGFDFYPPNTTTGDALMEIWFPVKKTQEHTVKQLEGLRIRQRSFERLGCIKGCLEYLGSDLSFPWLYGGTGQAFILGLDPGIDVSSPDSWDNQPQYDLGRNLGYTVDGLFVWKPDAEDIFPQKQREAWDFVRANIDRSIPCFGFELKAYYGGFWVIYGYDDEGYYYSGWEQGGPLPWNKLGELFIPMLEVHSVQRCPPAPDVQTVKEGLAFALKHAQNPPEWILGEARSGPAAWAYWAQALETGQAKRDHHTYNLKLWLECREMAVEFLQEAKTRLPGRCDDLFDHAAKYYAGLCEKLKELIELHPERDKADWGPDATFTSTKAAGGVRKAGALDGQGLACLQQIVDVL